MDHLEKIKNLGYKLSKRQLDFFNKERLENLLTRLNQICGSRFYFLDYIQGRLIVDTSGLPFEPLGGYCKEFIEEKGFGFLDIVFDDPVEQQLRGEYDIAAHEIFINTPIEYRTDLVLSYDLTIKRIDGRKMVLNHQVIPFLLDEKGNLWLNLAYVIISDQKKFGNPKLSIKSIDAHYEYIDGKFVKRNVIVLTDEEKEILTYMIKGYTGDFTASEMGMSPSSLRRRKFQLYQKVGVNTPSELIHWAHLNGII